MSIDTCAAQNLVDHAAFSSRLQYTVFSLRAKTLSTSGVLQEIQAVWRGQSVEIYKCLEDVEVWERDLEVCWFDPFFVQNFWLNMRRYIAQR